MSELFVNTGICFHSRLIKHLFFSVAVHSAFRPPVPCSRVNLIATRLPDNVEKVTRWPVIIIVARFLSASHSDILIVIQFGLSDTPCLILL